MTVDPSAEILRLRATVRDLLALSMIPEAWVGREPPAIAPDLADLLIGSLGVDFAFVRLCDPTGGQLVEVTRGNSWKAFPQWLQEHLAAFGQISRKEIVTNVSGLEESRCGIVIPIGVNSERGLVAAASDRSNFPDQIDQQLLSVAANNAAIAFHNAVLINELRSAQQALRANEQELRKARDELEVKVAERTAELRRNERELRDVIDTIPAIAWSALPDGSNSYVNSRFVEYCGMPPEQFAGSGWHAATHPDDLERHNAKWLACVGSGRPFEDEVRFRRADGQYRWHLQRGVPLRDEAGNIVKWYGVLTDIQDRKRAEQLQTDLAHTNRISTLGELAASISHELKQPITAAMANAQASLRWLNRDQPDLDEARQAAERVVKDEVRAAEIIDRLRSLYKKTPPRRGLVDAGEIIGEMILLLRREANQHGVSIRTDLAADLPKITADRVQLQQVLMNLMLNGIEAMKETGGVLTVKTEPGDGDQVLISVSDTGVGLPAGRADEIFNAFFTTKPQGSGMGLAISRSIIEAHGGRLWATPNEPRGAVFQFTLPTAGR